VISPFRFLPGALPAFGALAALLVAGPAAQPPVPSPSYTVTDLGTLGGPTSEANAINNRGQVAGVADLPDGRHHAFLWENGRMRDLGTLGGKNSEARKINNKGQIVGVAETRTGAEHAFLWSGGRMRDLGTFSGKLTEASGINDAGEIVGAAHAQDGGHSAILYQHGRWRRLKALSGGDSQALGINNKGQIVGESWDDGGNQHGFIYHETRSIDLGGYHLNGTSAVSINDRGTVAYTRYQYEECYAGVWEHWNAQEFGIFTVATAINNHGQIVGYRGGDVTFLDGGGRVHALTWRGDQEVKLNDCIPSGSGWYLVQAKAINDRGQIAGYGNHDGKQHAFLLTPK
jgi:probable HAF family extracellular repeat protein